VISGIAVGFIPLTRAGTLPVALSNPYSGSGDPERMGSGRGDDASDGAPRKEEEEHTSGLNAEI